MPDVKYFRTVAELRKADGVAPPKRGISKHLIRIPAIPLAGFDGRLKAKDQIALFLDAFAWWVTLGCKEQLRVCLFSGPHTDAVRIPLLTLCDSIVRESRPTLVFDGTEISPRANPRADFKKDWLDTLLSREKPLPSLAANLERQVGHSAFRWYQNVKSGRLSGRVAGLEVCRLNRAGTSGVASVGKPGKKGAESTARKRFQVLVGGANQLEIDETTCGTVAEKLRWVAEDRVNGELQFVKPEHALESRVLTGQTPVTVGEVTLNPIIGKNSLPFQMPALWYPEDSARYIDAMMQLGRTPYVVELKITKGNKIHERYYRYSIGQVVLYREFIRHASGAQPWFDKHELDREACRAAIAFPKPPDGADAAIVRLSGLAKQFDVQIAMLNV